MPAPVCAFVLLGPAPPDPRRRQITAVYYYPGVARRNPPSPPNRLRACAVCAVCAAFLAAGLGRWASALVAFSGVWLRQRLCAQLCGLPLARVRLPWWRIAVVVTRFREMRNRGQGTGLQGPAACCAKFIGLLAKRSVRCRGSSAGPALRGPV